MKSALLVTACLLGAHAHLAVALDLIPGVWTDITPPGVIMTPASHVFCQGVTLDPVDPLTIYLCVCAYEVAKAGLFKTTDGGATWTRIGQLDEPLHVEIDPKDRQHLYCVDGVRGNTIGFWASHDGGATWSMPPGFKTATDHPPSGVGTSDLYSIAVDPLDFTHVLVSFHSPWENSRNCGVLESTDGGASWTARQPPSGSAGGYGMAIFFLSDPALKQGDAKTWLFTAQQGGFFRTTDGGSTWTLVYPLQMTHGGNQLYRTKDGTLYAGAYQYPVRSTDNGASWQPLKVGLPYSWYIGICGDGTHLYTGCTGEHQPVFTAPEADGQTWKPLAGGTRTFSTDPFEMRFDRVHHILYSATFGDGFFAIKVPDAVDK
ncbi:MAG: exo-alpha-sialidase [Planctomycetes bacterium]|nr:exo-alpha-sialidase [Planctomycetota bacterium]